MIWDVPVARNASCMFLGRPESLLSKMSVSIVACGSGTRSAYAMTLLARALNEYSQPSGAKP